MCQFLSLLCWGLRSPRITPRATAGVFPALGDSGYGALVVVFAIAAVCETIPLEAMLVGRGVALHLGNLALHMGALVLVLADYRAIRGSAHKLDGQSLFIRLGARWRGTLPRSAIKRVSVLDQPVDWRYRAPRTVTVAPLGAANVEIELDQPVRLRSWWRGNVAAERVHLFVAEPARFLDELAVLSRLDVERSRIDAQTQ